MTILLKEEFAQLFDIHTAVPEGAAYSFSAREIAEPEGMDRFMDIYVPMMKALERKAAGAYLANWIASPALALLYGLSAGGAAVGMELSSLTLHLIPSKGYCRVAWSVGEWIETPLGEDREAQKGDIVSVLKQFYQETAGPLIREASRASGLSITDAWGQLPTRFNYYESMLEREESDPTTVRFRESYQLLKDLPADIFGLHRNPFKVEVRYTEDIADPGKRVQIRNRCCLYYCTEGGSLCYICPRVSERERNRRREENRLRAGSAAAE
ncbi:(2Fe-2S)-binding protein [Paenibacillus sp. HN-1]|uniref:(2Fe-2S)-binding protein n=1 Tax=Paenibacillus TaxID=44249 RepID=UPI001CA8AAD1|nr:MULTISPECIES: (2Fe-2S)-binding protein [Paenibacillus]MBY9079259.1 (2Fe-2S)-binding protein [Paenibacillus sp. CGMCC 1.18879]MBY9086982.1 (2Fe-2S)-binding protein [Paenibacillus sinensis]